MAGVEDKNPARSERRLERRESALQPHSFRVRPGRLFDRSVCERIEIAGRNVAARQQVVAKISRRTMDIVTGQRVLQHPGACVPWRLYWNSLRCAWSAPAVGLETVDRWKAGRFTDPFCALVSRQAVM